MIKKFIHSIGVVLSLFSVIWIITGSTIEFHQIYVYHNHLDLWQDMILKTNSKDSKKHIRFIEKNPNSTNISDFTANFNGDSGICNIKLSAMKICSGYIFDLVSPEYILYLTLRGPPVV